MAAKQIENETSGMWRDYKQAQKARRRIRLPILTQEILDLRRKGFHVVALTEYQFRVDRTLDLYPTHRRFHNLKTGKRGGYTTAVAIVNNQLRGKREVVKA